MRQQHSLVVMSEEEGNSEMRRRAEHERRVEEGAFQEEWESLLEELHKLNSTFRITLSFFSFFLSLLASSHVIICPWGSSYGSRPLLNSLTTTHFWNFADVTLADDDNNSILNDYVYRAIPSKLSELSQPFSTFPKKIVLISQLEVNEIFTCYGLNSLGPLVLWQCLKHIWNMHKSLYNLNSGWRLRNATICRTTGMLENSWQR